MMVTDLRCWWQNHYVGDFFRYVGDFLNVLNWSSTSGIGHQHLKLSPTHLVSNIRHQHRCNVRKPTSSSTLTISQIFRMHILPVYDRLPNFQFQRLSIKHSKHRDEWLIKNLVSAMFNHLKCNTSNIWLLWFVVFWIRKRFFVKSFYFWNQCRKESDSI